MESNNLFHDRYFLERLLGRGSFSEVWVAKDIKTDVLVALKIYAPATGLNDQGINVLSREFALLVDVNHKNLLKPLYYDVFERKPYLVLPYCKSGSILGKIGTFKEEDAWHLIHDVASGLAYLHSMTPAVIHQDIKPDNIMINDRGDYLIADFGISSHIRSTLRKSMSSAFASAGTPAYMAPERFSKDNTPVLANDIYSLGATVYEMLTGDPPFGDGGGLFQKQGAEIPIIKGDFSNDLIKVLNLCLQEEPWKRPTAAQLEKYAQKALNGKKIFCSHSGILAKVNKRLIFFGCLFLLLLVFMGIGLLYSEVKTKDKKNHSIYNASPNFGIIISEQGSINTTKDSFPSTTVDSPKINEYKKKPAPRTIKEKNKIVKEQKGRVTDQTKNDSLVPEKELNLMESISLSEPQAAAKRANPKNEFYVKVYAYNRGDEPTRAIVSLFVDGQLIGSENHVVRGRGRATYIFCVPNIKEERLAKVYAICNGVLKSKMSRIHFMPFI